MNSYLLLTYMFTRYLSTEKRSPKASVTKRSVLSHRECEAISYEIKKSSPEGLDIILLYLQYLILVVLQFVEYVVHNGSIPLNSV